VSYPEGLSIDDIISVQKLLDKANVPTKDRICHYYDPDEEYIVEVKFEESMSVADLFPGLRRRANEASNR